MRTPDFTVSCGGINCAFTNPSPTNLHAIIGDTSRLNLVVNSTAHEVAYFNHDTELNGISQRCAEALLECFYNPDCTQLWLKVVGDKFNVKHLYSCYERVVDAVDTYTTSLYYDVVMPILDDLGEEIIAITTLTKLIIRLPRNPLLVLDKSERHITPVYLQLCLLYRCQI